MRKAERVAELVDDQSRVGLADDHHLVAELDAVEAAVGPGDDVENPVVAGRLVAGSRGDGAERSAEAPHEGSTSPPSSQGVVVVCSETRPNEERLTKATASFSASVTLARVNGRGP
ncbi:MAG: hypothetical protein E6G60_11265 [Actinobacteria bacterium]|nr:MAG: hypothetical protein E6G60_11265 [Actinomycetota bacterium]